MIVSLIKHSSPLYAHVRSNDPAPIRDVLRVDTLTVSKQVVSGHGTCSATNVMYTAMASITRRSIVIIDPGRQKHRLRSPRCGRKALVGTKGRQLLPTIMPNRRSSLAQRNVSSWPSPVSASVSLLYGPASLHTLGSDPTSALRQAQWLSRRRSDGIRSDMWANLNLRLPSATCLPRCRTANSRRSVSWYITRSPCSFTSGSFLVSLIHGVSL